MATTFNMFDLIFVTLSLIFIIVAFFRGFVKEAFALLNWIITISLSYLATPYAAKFVAHYSSNKLVVNAVSGSIVFVLIFIVIALSTRSLAHDWKEKMPANLDRFFGVVFGVFKSLLIAGLFYAVTASFYTILIGEEAKISEEKAKISEEKLKTHHEIPEWLEQAEVFPIVKFSGKVVEPLVKIAIDGAAKNLIDDVAKPKDKKLDDKIDEVIDAGGALSDKSDEKKYDEKGYSKKEIEKMNRLIEIVE